MPRMKTNAQLRRMFGLAKPLNCGKADLEALAFEITEERTNHLSELYFNEANAIIKRLGGDAFPASRSRRAENHRNQEAGIKKVPSAEAKKYLSDLWHKYPHRTKRGLEALCLNTIKRSYPITALQNSKMIEAVKDMNRREELKPATSEAA